jgi:elongation factor G
VAGVERTIAQEKEAGLLHGFPLIDFRASLIEAAYREAGATDEMFAHATRAAFRKLVESRAVWPMEPILLATVHVLEEFVGPATTDLIKRRGKILDVEDRDTAKRIRALVPASNMFGYINVLMPLAEGRARYDAVFDHYAAVPAVPRA